MTPVQYFLYYRARGVGCSVLHCSYRYSYTQYERPKLRSSEITYKYNVISVGGKILPFARHLITTL